MNDFVRCLQTTIKLHHPDADLLIVGGFVRDHILGKENKDIDVEVYRLDPDSLVKLLQDESGALNIHRVDVVGKSFGVIKVFLENGDQYDVSVPRTESKQGSGHKGFLIKPDPNLTPHEAARRRDFTCNSMAMTVDGMIIDHFGGVDSINDKKLRATSGQFSEDPLRVLRGMQFAARFEMKVCPTTAEMCAILFGEMQFLHQDRIWAEWYKLMTKSDVPSFGLRFLVDTAWILAYPEIDSLIGLEQEPEWHPEGDAFEHTLHSLDYMAALCNKENIVGDNRVVLMLAILCHDFGKVYTTELLEGRIRSRNHAPRGEKPALSFLERIGTPISLINRILPLVTHHMMFCDGVVTDKGVRRLAIKLGKATIHELLLVIESDNSGRPPLPSGLHPGGLLVKESAELQRIMHCSPIPILKGRHLIKELGLTPSPLFGILVKRSYQLQLDGHFNKSDSSQLDQAIQWAKQQVKLME